MLKKILLLVAVLFVFTGCDMFMRDASVASYNLSQKADNFELNRRVVFYNGITGEYMLVIEGLCSIENTGNQLKVTCKTGQDSFKNTTLGCRIMLVTLQNNLKIVKLVYTTIK